MNIKQNRSAQIILVLVVIFAGILYANSQRIPDQHHLAIPFSVQAPLGAWEGNENCEETSAIMAAAFLSGDTSDVLPADAANTKIEELNAWELKEFGYNKDTGAEDTSRMIEETLGLKTRLLNDFSEKQLKKVLSNNHVILLPLNAEKLESSDYREIRPQYHMLVILGYDTRGFYVHDPGTSSGKNQFYTFEQLKNAAVDWDSSIKKVIDKKVVIEVWK